MDIKGITSDSVPANNNTLPQKDQNIVQPVVDNNINDRQNDQKMSLKDVGKKLDQFQQITKVSFKYEITNNPDMIIIKIVDQKSGEVVRQIPPEEAVKLAKAIDELLGVFIDKHV
ncbi:flagellar protein FlaG [Athalassotoga saccharophila]|uniref:flagellar protein FlaG n=1 Tax=Athalassotoga saccharophila TaxID=1441386 RepID=UPI00137A18DB|nr:flagellar protein FlaG [Athalassotoga saccharophila]BBJ28892.1 putative protein YvyC [Athalassotoga saccharophila]